MGSSDSVVAINASQSLIEFAFLRIREDIIFGRLRPGEKLKIDQVRDRYGLGNTPVREALSRLAATGLVEATPQRGFRISPVSEEDLEDVARLRIRLETEALRDSIVDGGDDWEAAVAAAHHTLYAVERHDLRRDEAAFATWETRNRAFHEALVSGCRSRWTLRFRATIYDQHERYRRIAHLRVPLSRIREVKREHVAIKEAALARDVEKACALTERHIARTTDGIRAAFKDSSL